jgi:chlorophyllide a reductase subunit Z
VLHYTDGLPPHELPIVVTGLAEEELGQTEPKQAMKRAHQTLDPRKPTVVVTGSIAEMIGGGVTPEGTGIKRFLPRTIDEDQWQSADRAMYWLWTEFGRRKACGAPPKKRNDGDKPRVNIIGPIYGYFNMPGPTWRRSAAWSKASAPRSTCPSRWAETVRRPAPGRGGRQHLHVSGVRTRPVRGLDRPYLQAPIGMHSTTKFLRKLGETLGLDPEPFIERREAHDHQARSGTSGVRSHRTSSARRASPSSPTKPMPKGLRRFLEEEMGLPCSFSFARRAGEKPDNDAVRAAVRERTPLILFGSFNERMYLAELGARAAYIPASFPGTIIRRHTGTPFMGYSGATYLVQEVCNALFDALFHILPLGTELDKLEGTPSRLHEELPWDADAKQLLDDLVQSQPVLVRISAAKRMREEAERLARNAGERRVTRQRINESSESLGGAGEPIRRGSLCPLAAIRRWAPTALRCLAITPDLARKARGKLRLRCGDGGKEFYRAGRHRPGGQVNEGSKSFR